MVNKSKKLLIVNSILLIAISLVLTYLVSVVILSGHSPFEMVGGVILLLMVVPVALLQFRATFKARVNSAQAVSVCFMIIGLLVLFALITTLIEAFQEEFLNISFISYFAVICAIILAYIALNIFLNLRWAKTIDLQKQNVPNENSKIYKKSTKILALIFVIIFSIGGFHGYLTSDSFQYAENLKSVNWLPETATNVSYYKSYFFTAYEFIIPEEDFLALAKKEGWKIEQITKPFEILRYTSGKNTEGAETEAIITYGYFYEKRERDGGGIFAAYDTEKQRAYFKSNPR